MAEALSNHDRTLEEPLVEPSDRTDAQVFKRMNFNQLAAYVGSKSGNPAFSWELQAHTCGGGSTEPLNVEVHQPTHAGKREAA